MLALGPKHKLCGTRSFWNHRADKVEETMALLEYVNGQNCIVLKSFRPEKYQASAIQSMGS